MHAFMYSYVHSCMHAYIHTYIHTYCSTSNSSSTNTITTTSTPRWQAASNHSILSFRLRLDDRGMLAGAGVVAGDGGVSDADAKC